MPVDVNSLDLAIAAIKKEYGENSIKAGNDVEDVKRISTGSLLLDYATGGGIPLGRWSIFYGDEHAGKSLVAWNVIRSAQRMGLKCAYYPVEGDYDPDYVSDRGVDIDDLVLVEGTKAEEIGNKMETLMASVHVHVLDSIASAVSVEELAAKVTDWQRAMMPRVWGKVFHRVAERFDTQENAIILINQLRDDMRYAGGTRMPGGRYIKHLSSMTLKFKRGRNLYKGKDGILDYDNEFLGLSGEKEADGHEVNIKCEKNRVGPRVGRTAAIRYDYEQMEFDQLFELTGAAVYYNVVSKKASWFELPNGDKVQGESKLRQAIAEDNDLRAKIEAIVKEKTND